MAKKLLGRVGAQPVAVLGRMSIGYSFLQTPFWWDKERSGGPIVEQVRRASCSVVSQTKLPLHDRQNHSSYAWCHRRQCMAKPARSVSKASTHHCELVTIRTFSCTGHTLHRYYAGFLWRDCPREHLCSSYWSEYGAVRHACSSSGRAYGAPALFILILADSRGYLPVQLTQKNLICRSPLTNA